METLIKGFGLGITLVILALNSSCGQVPGPQGAAGPQGSPGSAGPAGDPGQNGVDATSVSIVQLCQATTSYPNTFTEVAFCINDQLYGTYSQNGGFSTLLPPGNYASNGINSSCSFTIAAHCKVVN